MYISYDLYRSKNPQEIFNQEKVEFVIENDDHLVAIDDILNHILATHISNLPEVKKYGTAYIGRMQLVELEVTDKDILHLDEQQFRHFMATIMPNLPIKWSKTTNDMDESKTLELNKSEKD